MKKRNGIFAAIALLALTACSSSGSGSTAEVKKVSAKGMGAEEIVLNVTVDGGKVTKVEVVSHSETEGCGTKAIEELPAKFVEAGNADVEIITGATITSEAMIEAVKKALK